MSEMVRSEKVLRRELPVIAVLLAGGTGTRAGARRPKQFVRIAGKPVLQHTLEVFDASPSVDAIVIVADPEHGDELARIQRDSGARKVIAVVAPGDTRGRSTQNALSAIFVEEAKVLVHDGVRPLVDERIIADCADGLDACDALDVVIPTADTIVRVDAEGTVVDVPDRSTLRRGQTPQAFLLSVLRRAYAAASAEPSFTATDDCAVVRAFCPEVAISTVLGSENNIKITYPQDFLVADQLFRLRTSPPVPSGGATLRGRRYVVIGGTRGIGSAVTNELRNRGADVVAVGRSAGVDVRDQAGVERALADVARTRGQIDGVVVTAGVLLPGALVTAPAAGLAEMLEVNVLGSANVARAAHPYLALSHGHLLFFSSSSYTRGRAGQALYSATKAAISNLTQGLAEEWGHDGIRVNCISPGRTATDMRQAGFGDSDGLQCPGVVAHATAQLLASETSGSIVDVPPLDLMSTDGPVTVLAGV
ncbi:bifunctional cytidylyltransferase/SDR family oxidoreductase [Kineococcus sp. NUM-3379]